MDIVNTFFKKFYPPEDKLLDAEREFNGMCGGIMVSVRIDGFENVFPRMECTDGFSMSVQGHYGAYSTPRDDFADSYSRVEVGYPSEAEELLVPYCGDASCPTETVYGYVPISVVEAVIEKHGGIKLNEEIAS